MRHDTIANFAGEVCKAWSALRAAAHAHLWTTLPNMKSAMFFALVGMEG
jgi:hypothetical protein